MATRLYSLNRGDTDQQVVEAVGPATTTGKMEFNIDLASGLTKEDVLLALEKFQNWIVKGIFPPA